jgi:hypothetical protein
MLRQAQRGMQRACELRDVVDIGRLARHVQVRRLMRMRRMRGGRGSVTLHWPVHGSSYPVAKTLTRAAGKGWSGRVSR